MNDGNCIICRAVFSGGEWVSMPDWCTAAPKKCFLILSDYYSSYIDGKYFLSDKGVLVCDFDYDDFVVI